LLFAVKNIQREEGKTQRGVYFFAEAKNKSIAKAMSFAEVALGGRADESSLN
jgi:hypothetical protein